MKRAFVVMIIGILCLPMFSMLVTARADSTAARGRVGYTPPAAQKSSASSSDPADPPPPLAYDEEIGIEFTQSGSVTELEYIVSAVAQSDIDGYGPCYVLVGVTDVGYWYQVGLCFNWPNNFPNGGYADGFHFNYAVLDNSNNVVAGGLLDFSGPVNDGDFVVLDLNFASEDGQAYILMAALDLNTGSVAYGVYYTAGANYFVEQPTANGYYTGLVTAWWHSAAYYGGESEVVYTNATSLVLYSGILFVWEFSVTNEILFDVSKYVSFYEKPDLLQYLFTNGAEAAASGSKFVTGSSLYTTLQIGTPQYSKVIDSTVYTFVTSATPFTLTTHYGSGTISTVYKIYVVSGSGVNNVTELESYSGPIYLTGLVDGFYAILYFSYDSLLMIENPNFALVVLDNTAPVTALVVGTPQFTDASGNLYVASWTDFTLFSFDGESGVAATMCRIYNSTFDSGWQIYTTPFTLSGLDNGAYSVDYYSVDNVGNVETTQTLKVILNSKLVMIVQSYLEIQALASQVSASSIPKMLRDFLVLNVLNFAADESVRAFILDLAGNTAGANTVLGLCKRTMEGFISYVMNLKALGLIPAATADSWIVAAQTIINDINTAVASP